VGRKSCPASKGRELGKKGTGKIGGKGGSDQEFPREPPFRRGELFLRGKEGDKKETVQKSAWKEIPEKRFVSLKKKKFGVRSA